MVYGFDTTCHVLSIEHTHTQLVKLNVPLTIEDWKGQKTNKQKTNTAKKKQKTSNSNAHDMSEQSMTFLK